MPAKVASFTPRDAEAVPLGHLSVLVGPNNCGKSQTLRDIRQFMTSGSTAKLKILSSIQHSIPTELEAKTEVRLLPHNSPDHIRVLGVSTNLQSSHEIGVQKDWLSHQFAHLTDPGVQQTLLANMGAYWVAHLDAEGRFKLAAPSDSYDPREGAPTNALQAFSTGGKEASEELRTAFREAFSVDIALDWAGLRRLYLRIGEDFGEIPEERDKLDALLRDAPELSNQGDGYRSFAGVALAMLTFPTRLLLLDEPEAFLHPAQARVLGRWLAKNAKKRQAQVVVASHSADFLWGVVSEDPDTTVIRLNRSGDTTAYHVVPSEATRDLVQSPLLSSQPVLDSLFHKGVVVCEGDPDRAVYQTVAHTILRAKGGEDVLFIHSNGKDAVKSPVTLLRQTGTPACAIVDFDVLNSEKIFSDILEGLTGRQPDAGLIQRRADVDNEVEQITQAQLLEALRTAISQWLEMEHTDARQARKALVSIARQGAKWDAVKRQGVNFFQGNARTQVEELLADLRATGLFVVPHGQLESWMDLKAAKGQKWNRSALECLHNGGCPPALREFIEKVIGYLI